ncbi:hypothetical protein [Marinobacterium iners]|uniref:Uncharacterized protein n=1 Tax=Marinobacterium iners DSM 11526 TaxID=1122198 RepID=A0A1H3X8F0_9GAMM|nr:hypothetical protein [Marinobacterium iners]SDZ95520.1 hypothetical protein SAMN02745729_10170 [Marinobacterium iners DSM 11526]
MQIDDRDARQWYSALNDLTAGYTSDQIAEILQQGGFHSDKPLTTVASHVRGALNINRPDFFKVAELAHLMRALDRLQPLEWISAQVGCKPPERIQRSQESPEVLERKRQQLVDELGLVETRLSELAGNALAGRRRYVLFSQGK